MTQIIRMTGANGEGLFMKKYEELLFPNLDHVDPERGVQYARDFEYQRGDIIMCTYPKVGTHWMISMLWKLKIPDASKEPPDTSIEYGPPDVFKTQDDPRMIFTHLNPSRLFNETAEENGKVVLMLRNPKDVAVSYYHYLKDAAVYKSKQTWEEFFQSFIVGETLMGSYFTFLKEWESVLKDMSTGDSKAQVEVFYYEDFLQNPMENLARLNTFLGFDRDEIYLQKVLNETTFTAMRDNNRASRKGTHLTCDDGAGRSVIYRKGKVGGWETQMTVAQSETIDRMLQDALQHDIIRFKYAL